MPDANLSNQESVSDEPATRAFDHPLPPVTLPEPFAHYQILRLLGQGGMGAVYLARDVKVDRFVALKVPHFVPEDGAAARERFQRSARAAARLTHPNLCPIYEVGEFQGIPYLTMPYLEMPSLQSRLQEGLSPTPQQATALVHTLAVALQTAHQAGIVHRDLNPANILINPEGEPIIVDFGLARQLDTDAARLTQTGQMLGTPGYTAPEQLSGVLEAQSRSCDIFSLGVILYELLTGQLPFGRTLHDVLLHIMTRDPVPPSVQNPGIDPVLDRVCEKALARKVEERYASMGELASALLNYLRKQKEPIEQILAGVKPVVPEAIPSEDDSAGEPIPVAGLITAQQVREVQGRSLWILLPGAAIVLGGLLLTFLLRWPTEKARVRSDDVPFRKEAPADPEPFQVSQRPREQAPEILLCASNIQGKNQIVLLKRKTAGGVDLEIVKTLTTESNNSDAIWSPDGTKIAFASDRSGMQQIHVMDADGGNVKQLTREVRGASHPTWSSDGTKMAYQSFWSIVVSKADGTNPVRLSSPGVIAADPAWSPDGHQIAFCSKRLNNAFHLYVMDKDGANVRMLSTRDNPHGWVHPVWSPDGQYLAYGDFVDNCVELFVCDKDGNNSTQLTRLGGTNYRPSWTPDGKALCFRRLGSNAPDGFAIVQSNGSGFQEMRTPLQGSDSGFLLWKPSASDPHR